MLMVGSPGPKNYRKNVPAARRYYNDALLALDELCDSATKGSPVAFEKLRQVADSLVRAAGDMRLSRDLQQSDVTAKDAA
jgi:hypothetical protein